MQSRVETPADCHYSLSARAARAPLEAPGRRPLRPAGAQLVVQSRSSSSKQPATSGLCKYGASSATSASSSAAAALLVRLLCLQLMLAPASVVLCAEWPRLLTQQTAAAALVASKPQQQRRPESSSSIAADLEDLNDSSVRTRLGTVTIEHLGSAPGDFDYLIEKIAPAPPVEQSGGKQRVAADANNRTSMRFFRNSKTFASIVYTNVALEAGKRQPRRLINCHLVDLEKHASDVAIYETKYDIRTVDIEFKEMMQLLEACTNIARLRRRPPNNIGQQPGAPGSQYLAAGGAHQAPLGSQTSSAGAPPPPSLQGAPMRPVVLVGPPAQAQIAAASSTRRPQQQQQQQASQQQAAVFHEVMSKALNRELAQLNSDNRQQAAGAETASRLELPRSPVVFTELHSHNHNHNGLNININLGRAPGASSTQRPQHHHKRKRQQPVQPPQPPQPQPPALSLTQRGRFEPFAAPQLYANLSRLQAAQNERRRQLNSHQLERHPLVGALAQVGEQSRRLVLGEVTVPPTLNLAQFGLAGGGASGNLNMSANASSTSTSSLREALQEISSYDTTDLLSIWRGILPGTNWCGMGDRATSYNDLGFESDIDICCRAHDFCPVRLAAFTSGYGLFNWSFYTRSHCWCDQNFLDCLQQAESPLSAVVMKFYFSIMKTTCLNDIETDQQALEASKQQRPQASNARQSAAPKVNAGDNFRAPPLIAALKQSRWLQTVRNERPRQ